MAREKCRIESDPFGMVLDDIGHAAICQTGPYPAALADRSKNRTGLDAGGVKPVHQGCNGTSDQAARSHHLGRRP